MSSSADSNGLNMSPIFGPIYWGFVISILLGGISILQAYIYFPRTKDSLSVRCLAAGMIILDMISSSLVAQSVYYYLVPHFGSTIPLNSITVELSVECLISTILTFVSQLYFAEQVLRLSRAKISNQSRGRGYIIATVIAISALFAFTFGVACVVSMIVHKHGVLGNRSQIFAIFFGLAKGFGTLTDVIATIAMCFSLSSSKTGFQRTNWLINTLMHFVIHRGIFVTLIQALLLITFFAIPSSLAWLAFHVNVTKLYVNVFFAMLNSRENLTEQLEQKTVMSLGSSFRLTARGTHASHGGIINEDYHDTDHTEKQQYTSMPTITKSVIVSDL